ncbi:MAG TPA: molybdenum cofactor biosynthesis protein MoaE [Actinomycetota bacterium]|nr:molybdenum cofactor biosynthesis protein MoaE [Actinomycetota bacterium]
MRVRIKMFGALAERSRMNEAAIDFEHPATTADVVQAVRESAPELAGILERISIAVNHEISHGERPLRDGDEVALMPPVAGGAAILVGLRDHPSADDALAAVRSSRAGGTAVFVGTVRDRSDGRVVDRLEYSAYEEMADAVLGDIAGAAAEKWGLEGVAVLHGVGEMRVGDVTVVVACSAAHRAEALEACRWMIDEVKSRVPIWKKESGPEGSRWVGIEP